MKNIYLCGPTVYNTPHIGNMRPIITFDMYIRALNAQGVETNFIHNLTDIDDKIINKALEEEVSEEVISERYIAEYRELLINYNIQSPDSMPKVTDNIESIISYIEELVNKGFAYELNGDVYYSIESDVKYGSISNRDIDQMRFEESDKRHPGDFALWKNTSVGVTFDSPWSKGRPGWHTECALFIDKELKGESLDVHGGGVDLLFPHHENEATQYRTSTGNEIAKDWKHVGHLSIEGDKMSKSLNNGISAIEFADEFGPDVLRMLFLSSSPTGPINLTDELLTDLDKLANKWSVAYNKAQLENESNNDISSIAKLISEWKFAEANKEINLVLKEFNKTQNNPSQVIEIMKMLGFNFSKNIISNEIKEKYFKWKKLRDEAKYEEADAIREELMFCGLI